MAKAAFFGLEDGTVLVRSADGVSFSIYHVESPYCIEFIRLFHVCLVKQTQQKINSVPGINDDVVIGEA